MRKITTVAVTALASIALGVGLYVLTAGLGWRWGDHLQLLRRGDVALILLPVVWMITSVWVTLTLPPRRRSAMISGMSRTRVVVTDTLKTAIVSAYIGDGQPSIREVAAKVKCSYGTAHRVLSEAGLTRPRGATKAARARKAATA